MQGDELLLRRACKGDVQAFEELMQSHESRIYAIALRMMGNREDAQDCAQEAMVRIYRRFKEENLRSKMIMQVHDELNFDVVPAELDRVREIVTTEMQGAYHGEVPLTASSEAAENWLLAH